jgi:hypothetical protein
LRLTLAEIRTSAMMLAAEWTKLSSPRTEAQSCWIGLFAVFGIKRREFVRRRRSVR